VKKTILFALLALVFLAAYLPGGTYAQSNLRPAQGCPTYLTNLTIDIVNSNPTQITTGDLVVTTFHVIYPDGTPVTLTPQTASFLWVGAAGQQEFDNVQVTYTGNPGFYNYTQTVTPDLATATLGSSGTGTVTIYAASCSCSDALGNRGPTQGIGSDQTLTPSDDSHLNVGPTVQPQPITTFLVPIVIAIFLILALLLFLRRSRAKKKK
jgi:hypothetical protein